MKNTFLTILVALCLQVSASDIIESYQGVDQDGLACGVTVSIQGGDFVAAKVQFNVDDEALEFNMTNLTLESFDDVISKKFWIDINGEVNYGEPLFLGSVADIKLSVDMSERWESRGFSIFYVRESFFRRLKKEVFCKF